MGKAQRILTDPEVKQAIENKRASSKLYILQEGMYSAEDVKQAKEYGKSSNPNVCISLH